MVVRRFLLNKDWERLMGKEKKEIDKEQIASEICEAAKLYKRFLVGKRFLYAFDGRYIEVLYKAQNFRHLTGVACNMSAKDFYKNAVNDKLQGKQIYFSNRHPYSLCKRKVKHLCEISILASTENIMLEEIVAKERTFKFGSTDLEFTLCMNKEHDAEGNKIGDCYIVESLRDEDCFSKSKEAYEVTHILSRANDAPKYTDVLFIDKKETIATLPDEVKPLLERKLLEKAEDTE